jgi:RNA ligase
MRIDLAKLQEEIDGGWVNVQTHPSLPLRIIKYSKSSVYSARWNEITLRSRGVVIDADGVVAVNGFEKFFNNNQAEGVADYERSKHLSYTVSVKEDGSLIQIAKWNGHLIVTSSGSFSSPQVQMAQEMLAGQYNNYVFKDGLTYLFELVHPGNRIVLNYGERKSLILLAIRDTETGEELALDPMFECVEFRQMTIEDILKELPREDYINLEGYIVRFSNGVRIKYKYDKYVVLHKVISGISSKWVWECLSSGLNYRDTAVDIPDELDDWIKETAARLQNAFDESLKSAHKLYEEVVKISSVRKEQALFIQANHKIHAKEIFGLLDGRDISKLLWDKIEPKGGGSGMKWGMGASAEENHG